jgi:threonine/homoserine/homoserine lactone efflux protein
VIGDLMELAWFLVRVVGVSLSGVMMPGPVTAAAIAMGSRNRWAGALMAVGHGIVEFPLIVLITLGMKEIIESTPVKIVIGLAGGAFLIIMAAQMLKNLESVNKSRVTVVSKSAPLLAGVILSGGNPYFFLWWATVGLALATTATGLGVWAFVLFAIVHWLCDLIWLEALSWASFKGSVLLSPGRQRIVMFVCAVALFGFGLLFIAGGGVGLVRILTSKV